MVVSVYEPWPRMPPQCVWVSPPQVMVAATSQLLMVLTIKVRLIVYNSDVLAMPTSPAQYMVPLMVPVVFTFRMLAP